VGPPNWPSIVGLTEGKPDADAPGKGPVGAPDGASLFPELLVGLEEGNGEGVAVAEVGS
jgi:hypothetical protein